MEPVLLYDADCGFCTRCARWLEPRLRTARIAPLHSVDLEALGIDADRTLAEIPFRNADGAVTWGSDAIADALVACGPVARVAGRVLRLPPVGVVARPAYRALARHRHRLPGGTAACRIG